VLTGITVIVLALACFAYPSLKGYLIVILSIVQAFYLAYMGGYVWYDWDVESLEPKLRKVRSK